MFPSLRQRAAILAAVVAGGLLFMAGVGEARAADGATGCTLLLSSAPMHALLTFIALAVPVVVLASIAGATGNPLGGVFAAAAALIFAAVAGGSIDETLRSASSSRVYLTLAAESVAWGGLVAAMAAACLNLSHRIVARMPALAPAPVPASTTTPPAPIPADAPGLGKAVAQAIGDRTGLPPRFVQLGLALLVTAVVGGAIAALLVRTIDPWQVVWGMIIGFSLGGLLAHQMFPTDKPTAILLGPLLAAVVFYLYQAMTGGSGEAFRAAYFEGRLIGPALALPVYYASAGVAGAAVGIGWSQIVFLTREVKSDEQELPKPHVPTEV